MMKAFFISLTLLISIPAFATFGTIDTTHTPSIVQGDTTAAWNEEHADNDFAPGLAVFAFFGIVLICIGIGVGIVVAGLATFLLLILIALGVISTAVLVGINKRSVNSGVKTLLILGSCLLGTITGSLLMVAAVMIFKLHYSILFSVVCGGGIGLLAGMCVGFLLYTVYTRSLGRILIYVQQLTGK